MSDRIDRIRRTRLTAASWFRRSTALLLESERCAANDDTRWLVGYEAAELLEAVLFEAESLVGLIADDDLLARAGERLDKLSAALRARKASHRRLALSEKLSRVEGRTPEEAALYRAKAAELTA